MRTSVVEINGNRYDATTGQIINAFKTAGQRSNQVIDGFVKTPKKLAARTAAKSAPMPPRQETKSAQLHQRPQRAQTLRRDGLKRPVRHVQSHLQRLTPGPRAETEFLAKTTSKHSRVNRFGVPNITHREASQPTKQAISGEIINSGHHKLVANQSVTAAPLPSMVASASHQRLERLLDEALTKADAHKQALRYQAARHFWQRRWFKGPKRWVLAAALVLAIGVGGVLAWRNIPQLSVKLASIRAHLSLAVPSYKPDGYKLASPAKVVSGAVAISYKSATDPSQSYVITQAKSDLTDQSVAQNIIPKGAPVQTSQVEGNTVYIYGSSNNAAWVNNGVLYSIKDKADLSSDQLLNIVKGINP